MDLLGDNYYAKIGGARLGMLLLSYGRSDEPTYNSVGVRTGTAVKMTLTGEISAASQDALKTAIGAVRTACLAAGDVQVYASGQVKEELLAANCTGPITASLAYTDPNGALTQGVTVSIGASGAPAGGEPIEPGELVWGSYVTTVRYDAQNLVTVIQRGTLVASGSGAAALAVAKLPDPDVWHVVTSEQTANNLDTEASYTWTKQSVAVAYPADGIVEGEQTVTTLQDRATNRKLISYSYDYQGGGAAAYLTAQLAALAAAGGLVASSYAETTHKQTRATLACQVLASRDASNILEFSESVRVSRQSPLLEVRTYPGAAPLIAQLAQAAWLVEQTGRAVGRGGYPSAAPALYAAEQMSEAPDVQYGRISNVEMETSWRYAFLFVEDPTAIMPHSYATYGGTVTPEE